MPSNPAFSPPARALIVAGAGALIVILMKEAAPILAPGLLAVFITIIAFPALRWMRRHGVPKWAALVVIAFVLLDAGSLLALVATGALEGFRDSLPTYQERFVLLSDHFGRWAEGLGLSDSRDAVRDLMDPNKAVAVVRLLLSSAGSLFATGLMVLIAVIVMLHEAPKLPAKIDAAFNLTGEGDARLMRLLGGINRYMQIKTLLSLATAFCVWFLLWVLGVDFAMLWALLAFFLNFVPVVGGFLMMIPAILLALLETGWQTALLVFVGYELIHFVISEVLEPKILGKRLGISELSVILAVLFWGWLFGVVGMFLAVPLTTALIIALEASPHTRPIAILLGPEISKTPEPDESMATAGLDANPECGRDTRRTG